MEPAINPDLTHNVKAPFDLTWELLHDVGWTFPDADGDTFADDEDCNANSDVRPTIIIDGIDTGVPNRGLGRLHDDRRDRPAQGDVPQPGDLRLRRRPADQPVEGRRA